ncbi:MAG: helicase HerA domain-containing protein [Salinirussus sp.]
MTGEHIEVTEPGGDDVRLPLVDILTGRGFVTGKSGSGKSTSVNVIVEEILDLGQPLLIVDTDGEYWGLKEQYQLLHLGNDEQCDVRVTATDAEKIVDLALVERVPIILDTSGFIHEEDAQDVVFRVVRELFHREKTLKEPFLLIVEEVHEYIPETGGLTEMGEMLIQVAKRGRKHGLGFCGVSQRPASVDKDFITQCDWIVWHRLTWKNDTEVVRSMLGSDAAATVEELDPGECLLMTDWDERLRRVQFRQKRTFDAGATPGFEDFEPPPLVPVDPAILERFDERRQNVDYSDLEGDEPMDSSTDSLAIDQSKDDTEEPEQRSPETEASVEDESRTDSTDQIESSSTADVDPPVDSNDRAEIKEAERSTELDEDNEIIADAPERRRPKGPRPANGRKARASPATTPPASGTEGILVEFAELVLFLTSWIRAQLAAIALVIAGHVGSTARWIATRTDFESDDIEVVLWAVIAIGGILVLAALIGAFLS